MSWRSESRNWLPFKGENSRLMNVDSMRCTINLLQNVFLNQFINIPSPSLSIRRRISINSPVWTCFSDDIEAAARIHSVPLLQQARPYRSSCGRELRRGKSFVVSSTWWHPISETSSVLSLASRRAEGTYLHCIRPFPLILTLSRICVLLYAQGSEADCLCTSSRTATIMKAARSGMLGSGTSNCSFKYSRLAADEDGYIDLQVSHGFRRYTAIYGILRCTWTQ